jgi:hypothetical protein
MNQEHSGGGQPWDETARLVVDVFLFDSNGSIENGQQHNNGTTNTYYDPLAQFEDDGHRRSAVTMGTFGSTNDNSGIVVIDIGDPGETLQHACPLHLAGSSSHSY